MRFSRMASAVSVCIGAALLAARAQAAPVSPLLEGSFDLQSGDDSIQCSLGANSGTFYALAEVQGLDTGGLGVEVAFNTPQPTSASRGTDKLSVKQSQFAALSVLITGHFVVSNVPIEKCSVNGSFTKHKAQGAVSVRCKGDDLSALLSADYIASLKTAMQRKHVKLTVDKANAKWSLSIDCSGAWSL
jgi:hypothetical protein